MLDNNTQNITTTHIPLSALKTTQSATRDNMIVRWTKEQAQAVFHQPFNDLLFQAQAVHREHFKPNEIQVSTLLSIKTGSCPENCAYCPQSAHYQTGLEKEPLMEIQEVVEAAKRAKAAGSTRFCMGAAWRGPNQKDLAVVCDMVKEVKSLGLETCVTLGLLKDEQAQQLKESGLDFYNHNIDTSEEHYKQVITTRTFDDRIQTLARVRDAGVKVCCGGILGMGESNEDRIHMLVSLANMSEPPESVPINQLIKIPGTPLADVPDVDPFEFVRTIALARVMMPKSYIRLSAGREQMPESVQALCFMAGANSIFYGEKLLTADNPTPEQDNRLFEKLGLTKQMVVESHA
jgi:biotin synthase